MSLDASQAAPPERADDASSSDTIERALETLSSEFPRRAAIEPMIRELEARGAGTTRHSGRTFIHHLVGTWRILAIWGHPAPLCNAGLFHSVYGTQYFRQGHFSADERDVIRGLIGEDAEEIAYLFCALDRSELARAARDHRASPAEGLVIRTQAAPGALPVSAVRVAELLALEAANVAEQSCETSGAPTPWLGRIFPMIQLAATRLPFPPSVLAGEAALGRDAEMRALASYAAAIAAEDGDETERAARQAALDNPWVGEPLLALACAALEREDAASALRNADLAVKRLVEWGTAWDKRHSWQSWLTAALGIRAEASELVGSGEQAARDRAHAARLSQLEERRSRGIM
jgi:hypothetical protein